MAITQHDTRISPDVALPLIQNRLERLAVNMPLTAPLTPETVALLGIVRDLADVVAQLAEQVSSS